MPGVVFIAFQGFQPLKLTDQNGIIIIRTHMDCHLAAQLLGDHTWQRTQTIQKLLLLRLGARTELPHHDMTNDAFFLAL